MVGQIRRCGGPTVPIASWGRAISGRRTWTWPQLHGRHVIGTFKGRTAISIACQILKIGAGDQVLVPAYNCGTELDAISHSGAEVTGYPVTREGGIDVDELKKKRRRRTRAIYVIHYFGWEHALGELRSWCDNEGLLLIEDCALSLLSTGQWGDLGRVGDAAIFSLTKTFGVKNGGLLSLKTAPTSTPHLQSPGMNSLMREVVNSFRAKILSAADRAGILGRVLHAKGLFKKREPDGPGESLPPMPSNYYFDPNLYARRALPRGVERVVATMPWQDVVERRRLNYSRLAEALSNISGVQPVFPILADGVCPLSLPLITSLRDLHVKRFQASGISALPWWAGFHRSALPWEQFPDACFLKRNVLTLPVHQYLGDSQLSYIEDVATRVLRD